MEFTKEDFNIGGSAFWILFILIALMGLVYLMIWSFQNNSVKGTVISTLFLGMIFAGILLSRLKVFDFFDFQDNALSFTLGFFIWALATGNIFGTQSVLSVSENYLFATIASELPQIIQIIVNVFIVPIAEELFWMIGIPFALISIMNQIGKSWEFAKNSAFQISIIVIVGALTFAFFHVGKSSFTYFMIVAMVFRTIMIVLIYGDYNYDILKGVNLVVGFSVGAHIANNMMDVGINNTWLVLKTEPIVLVIVLVLFGVLFLTAFNRILQFALGKTKTLESSPR